MKCYIKDYPRPQLVRKDWKNLNGKWKFWYGDEEQPQIREITVPFTYETPASGINDTEVHGSVWYERTVEPMKCGSVPLWNIVKQMILP